MIKLLLILAILLNLGGCFNIQLKPLDYTHTHIKQTAED